jgi:sec-independent protein translocase protein TatC
MSLADHLGELRRRLIISVAAVGLGALVGFFLWNWVLDVATQPYCDAQAARGAHGLPGSSACTLYFTNGPLELFTTRLTIAGYLGFFFASPVVLWQLWRFITPGLHPKEKRYAVPFVTASVGLFLLGAWVAWMTFPRAISFFLSVGGDHVLTLFGPGPYLKLIALMMLVFGLAFEIPLILVFLQLARVVSSARLRRWRRQAIVANFAIAAIATPSQDPYSMCTMAIPMCIFYEVAIIVGRVMKR